MILNQNHICSQSLRELWKILMMEVVKVLVRFQCHNSCWMISKIKCWLKNNRSLKESQESHKIKIKRKTKMIHQEWDQKLFQTISSELQKILKTLIELVFRAKLQWHKKFNKKKIFENQISHLSLIGMKILAAQILTHKIMKMKMMIKL